MNLQLVLVGPAVGRLITLLILSPLGRASGGLAGSALGPIVDRLVWGSPAARTPVLDAALHSAAGWTFWDFLSAQINRSGR